MAISAGKGSCFELQTGYSLPRNIALSANFMTGERDRSTKAVDDLAKVSYFEGSLGFYRSFKTKGVFEIFAGYGHGSQHHTFAYTRGAGAGFFGFETIPDGLANLSFSKVFIQPDIGFKTKYFEGAFSFRLSRLSFNEINIFDTIYHLDALNNVKENSVPWFFEPGFTIRGGPEATRFQMQLVVPKNLTNPKMMSETFRISLGIAMELNLFKKEENK
jgi:hypothetical protein